MVVWDSYDGDVELSISSEDSVWLLTAASVFQGPVDPSSERRNDFKLKLAVEQSQKTAAAAATPHYDESYNVLSAFRKRIERERERDV